MDENRPHETTYTLWSFQDTSACELLEKTGTLRTDWQLTPINWRPAYQWMAAEMERRQILLNGFAPIWAWHSCDGVLQAPPTMGLARGLLTDLQILKGICVVEMNVPASICLLSSYQRFNDLLDLVLDKGAPIYEDFYDMFEVLRCSPHDSIQATLPYLDMTWILDIRQIDLKPDRWDYDWQKLV